MKNIIVYTAAALGLLLTPAAALNASSIRKVEAAPMPDIMDLVVLFPWCASRVIDAEGISFCTRTIWFAPTDDEEIMEEADGFSPLNPRYVSSETRTAE